MKPRRVLALFLAFCFLCAPVEAAQSAGSTLPTLRSDHGKYMDGCEDGYFRPDSYLTRAQAAQMLFRCLSGDLPVAEEALFCDVPTDAWYAPAVQTLGLLDIFAPAQDGSFRPDDYISRGELAMMLAPFLDAQPGENPFTDVNDQQLAYQSILITYAAGVFNGRDDGLFHPGSPLTRAEAAASFSRLLGRSPDSAALSQTLPLRFPDVTPDYWAYGDIMEATVSHTVAPTAEGAENWTSWTEDPVLIPDGLYRIHGRLYQVASGHFLHDVTADGFSFDALGRYTTGSEELDSILNDLVETYSSRGLSREETLRALYEYVRDHFTYLKRSIYGKAVGWEPEAALLFWTSGKGNCYSFSAFFSLLARELGYSAKTVPGYLGKSRQDHCWVVIPEDGIGYMYDPQLEWRYLHDRGVAGYDLFKMRPGNTPFIYTPM